MNFSEEGAIGVCIIMTKAVGSNMQFSQTYFIELFKSSTPDVKKYNGFSSPKSYT